MRRSHLLATAGFAALIALGSFLLARTHLPSRAKTLRNQLAQTATQLTAEPESVPTSAIDQRYRVSHQAISAMRRDLARLVAFESTYVADSGRPNALSLPPLPFPLTPGTMLSVRLRRDGWSATASSNYTSIRCMVSAQVLDDSRTSLANPVVCVGPNSAEP